jgi:hypothetical protein
VLGETCSNSVAGEPVTGYLSAFREFFAKTVLRHDAGRDRVASAHTGRLERDGYVFPVVDSGPWMPQNVHWDEIPAFQLFGHRYSGLLLIRF